MSRKNCKLCDHFIISTQVYFSANRLVIVIPKGCYNNNENYCIVVAQKIPDNTTVKAKVFIQIEGGSVLYPVTKCNCQPITACAIHTRTKYCMRVCTSPDGGIFKMLNTPYCYSGDNLKSIDGTPAETESEHEHKQGGIYNA